MGFFQVLWDSFRFFGILSDSLGFFNILWDSLKFSGILSDSLGFFTILSDSFIDFFICLNWCLLTWFWIVNGIGWRWTSKIHRRGSYHPATTWLPGVIQRRRIECASIGRAPAPVCASGPSPPSKESRSVWSLSMAPYLSWMRWILVIHLVLFSWSLWPF